MITRDEAISTIESVLRDAATRATKPLRPDAAAVVRAEALAAYDASPARFPTAWLLAKYVKLKTAIRPSTAGQAEADPPATTKRRRMPGRAKKPILDEMSPGGESALRRWEGE
jgi:hypothetical protein